MFDSRTTKAKEQATSKPTAARVQFSEDHRDADLKLGSARRVGYSFARDKGQAPLRPFQRQENKTGLPDALKMEVEHLSGLSLDDVKVHYNSAKPAGLSALAYTQGTDIHVAPGQEKHLPHEAWHAVQQKQGRVQPTIQLQGKAVNNDSALEREANMMGVKASQGQTSRVKPGQEVSQAKLFSISSTRPPSAPIQMMKSRPTRDAAARASRVFGINRAGKPIRKNTKAPQPFIIEHGKPSIVSFTFKGTTKKGLHPGGAYTHRAKIKYTGSRAGDFKTANTAVGKAATPPGFVWHHYHNYNPATNEGTLYLMRHADHAPSHFGGVWMYEQHNGITYG